MPTMSDVESKVSSLKVEGSQQLEIHVNAVVRLVVITIEAYIY